MTTTAEKINYIVQDLAVLREDIQRLDRQIKDIINEAEPKPADPEPLEFLVHHGPDKAPMTVREVTPQMLKDEKDAARYRWLIENGRKAPGLYWDSTSEWSEIIDNAMEEE